MGVGDVAGKAAAGARKLMRSGTLLLLIIVLSASITGFLYLHFMGSLTTEEAVTEYMTTAFEHELEQRLGEGGVSAIQSGMISCDEAASAFEGLSFSCTDIKENGLRSVTEPIAEHYYGTSDVSKAHQTATDYKPLPLVAAIIALVLLVALSGSGLSAAKLTVYQLLSPVHSYRYSAQRSRSFCRAYPYPAWLTQPIPWR